MGGESGQETRRNGLKDEGGALLGRLKGAGGAAAGDGAGFDDIGGEGVFAGSDERVETRPEAVKAFLFEPALEEAFLDAEAEVFTGEGDAAETAGAGDVVGNEAEHFRIAGSVEGCGVREREEVRGEKEGGGAVAEERPGGAAPENGGHGGLLQAEGKELCVGEGGFEGEDGVVHFLTESGVLAGAGAGEGAMEAFFVVLEENAASGGVEENAAVALLEVIGTQHAVGKDAKGKGFGDGGAEGFHEVEGECPAAVGGGVEGTESGIEAAAVAGAEEFAVEDGGGVGEDGVDGIARGPGAAAAKGELRREELLPDAEVELAGQAFEAAESLKGGGAFHFQAEHFDTIKGGAGIRRGPGGLEALQQTALAGGFGQDEGAGGGEAKGGVEGALVLGETDGAVGRGRRGETAEAGALGGVKEDRDVAAEEFAKGGGGDEDVFAEDDPLDFLQRQMVLGRRLPVLLRGQGEEQALGFQAEAGLRGFDPEGGHGDL